MIRHLFAIAFGLALTQPALAGGNGQGQGPGQGQQQQPGDQQPQPPQGTYCDGVWQGFLSNAPGPLVLQIQQSGPYGEVQVIGHWGGNTWVGHGACQQVTASEAQILFQFPNTPMQRGIIWTDPQGQTELDGQVDGGVSFHLMRQGMPQFPGGGQQPPQFPGQDQGK